MGKLWTVLLGVAVAYAVANLTAGVPGRALADEPVIVTGEVVAADGAVRVEKVKTPEKAEKGEKVESTDIRIIINGKEVKLGELGGLQVIAPKGEKGERHDGGMKLELGDIRVLMDGKEVKPGEGDVRGCLCGGVFFPTWGALAGEHGFPLQLSAAGEKKYGFLGVAPAPVPGPLADQLELTDGRGVLLAEVEEGTPAAKAGLATNDVITQIDDQIIYSIEQLKKLVAARKPGSAVRVQFIHKSKPATATVELGGTAEKSWLPSAHEMGGMPGMPPFHNMGPGMMGGMGGFGGINPINPMQPHGQGFMPPMPGQPGQPMQPGQPGQPGQQGWLQLQPGQPMNPEQAQAQAREMMEKMLQKQIHELRELNGKELKPGQPSEAQAREMIGRLEKQIQELREHKPVRPGQSERPEANPRPGQPVEVRPPAGEKKLWTASEIIKLREQLHYGILIEVQDAIYKKLANLDGAKLTAEQAIELLAPLKGRGTIGEVEWQWLTDTLQGKQVGPCPVPGGASGTGPAPTMLHLDFDSVSAQTTTGGLVTSTVSASSPHYSATWTSRTGQPITVTLISGKDKVVFKDLPVSELAKMLPTLDPEARELLSRINLGGK